MDHDSGTGELATAAATNDAVWDAFNDGFGESVGSIGDGDPFWAGIVTLDDRDHYGALTNETGQRRVYAFATEERATAWLDEMRARLS
jgi:hypothetical protein